MKPPIGGCKASCHGSRECHWTAFHWIDGLQDMLLRLDNMRRQLSFSKKCNKMAWLLTNSLFVLVLNACASLWALEESRQAHEQVIQNGCEVDVFVGCSLVDIFATCRSMDSRDAQQDAISRCGHLEWHGIGTCQIWAWTEGTQSILTNATRRCAILWGCWMHVPADHSKLGFRCLCGDLLGMQNVGSLMILRECSTRCHHTMWSLETPYYGDMLNVGKAEGTGTISMNAAGRCEATLLLLWGCSKHVPSLVQAGRCKATLCYFCGDAQWICHH